jgi:homoaconitate hydratase
MTLQEQAQVVMENYDPTFRPLLSQKHQTLLPDASDGTKQGTILVAGYNFGTGSSQAATALKAAGVYLVIAGSFGDIFKRNAINNGLVCMECPELVEDLTEGYAKDGKRGAGGKNGELTVDPGMALKVGMRDGRAVVTRAGVEKTYTVRPVGTSVQELWVCGGLEGYILKEIRQAEA